MRLARTLGVVAATALASAGPATAAPACLVGKLLELPVTMVGRRPMVDGAIEGHPARFMADSGAFFSLIAPGEAAADGLRLEPLPGNFRLRGIGGAATASVTHVKSFTLAGHAFSNVEFVVGGSEFGGTGLIGQNVLGLADVEYDLANGAIRLMRPYYCGDADLAYWSRGKPHSVLPIASLDLLNRHTEATVTVNGHPLRAFFDTGAATSILTQSAAKRAEVPLSGADVRPGGTAGGLGRDVVRTVIAPVASFKVGDEEIRETRLRVGDLGPVPFDMLIGADFFLSHRVYVANGQKRLYLSYNGGPVFDLSNAGGEIAPAAAPPAIAVTDDADTLARRGAALAARREFDPALAAYDRAVTLAPGRADILFGRARVHLAARQPLLAASDLDAGLRIAPDDIDARLLRAILRLAAHDPAGARGDLDAAAQAAVPQADQRLGIGELYGRMGAFDPALAQLDLWITAHPDDRRLGSALAERGLTRAFANQDLGPALDDCNRALHLRPDLTQASVARGLVRLRRGEGAKAIADFDAALARDPKLAWALWGRGVAKRAAGDTAGGGADLAAAQALRPGLAAEAARLGFGG